MRLRNRPLLVDGIDAELYVGRPALEASLLQAVRDERNTLLLGPAGSGKSTLLRKLAADVRDRPVAWVDGTLPSDGVDLLHQVARELPLDPMTKPRPARPAPSHAIRLLDALETIGDRPALIIVDDPVDGNAAYDVFGRLRDRLWTLPHVWVVAARPEQSGALRAPPADAFWAKTLEVAPMNGDEIDELLRRGLDETEYAKVTKHGAPLQDTPRRVVRWAQATLREEGEPMSAAAIRREALAARLGRPASMLLAELEALDRPVTASDEELLRRLGWSRSYAARWLVQLEEAGLARAFTAPAQGQGRPPRLFELA
jgi:energy-coupling factor transporter ATP-binding protein EcfA2